MVNKSRNKIHQTWPKPFGLALYQDWSPDCLYSLLNRYPEPPPDDPSIGVEEEAPNEDMILGPSDGYGLEDDPSPEDDLPHESNLEPKPEIDDVTLGVGNWGVQAPEQVEPVASGSRSEAFPVLRDLLSGTDNASAMAGELEIMEVEEEEEEEDEEGVFVFSGIGGESSECDSEEQSTNQWSCKCEYKCLECGRIYNDACSLIPHLHNRHGMDVATYKAKHGLSKLMTREVRFCCHLCGSSFQWKRVTIERHAKSKHNMSIHQ